MYNIENIKQIYFMFYNKVLMDLQALLSLFWRKSNLENLASQLKVGSSEENQDYLPLYLV